MAYDFNDHVREPRTLGPELTWTASGAVTRGNFYKVADTYVVAYQSVDDGELASGHADCNQILVPKATGVGNSIALGELLYLDTTALTVSNTSAVGKYQLCSAIRNATEADTKVLVKLYSWNAVVVTA